jgi:hypothetical protein
MIYEKSPDDGGGCFEYENYKPRLSVAAGMKNR